jgi:hypothetical protein
VNSSRGARRSNIKTVQANTSNDRLRIWIKVRKPRSGAMFMNGDLESALGKQGRPMIPK